MSLASQYLLYITAFRLAIIAAGVICVVLGYKLFVQGRLGRNGVGSTSSLEAKLASARFALKNAAPGTGFGLFGVILITVMLVQGSPEFVYETLKKAAAEDNTTRITIRGGETADKFSSLVQKGVSYEQSGDSSRAIGAYREALSSATLPMNQLAWLYLQQGKPDDALPPARLAAALNPDNADVLDTLAEVLAKHGDRAEAVKWMEKAAALDSRYRTKLTDLKQTAR